MVSTYRVNNGLGAIEVDPVLTRAAETQAEAMAKRNKLDHNVIGELGSASSARAMTQGSQSKTFRPATIPSREAFSGWRKLPPHRENMLRSGVTKMGIAAVYAPNTRYKVFWAMILAAPDTP